MEMAILKTNLPIKFISVSFVKASKKERGDSYILMAQFFQDNSKMICPMELDKWSI